MRIFRMALFFGLLVFSAACATATPVPKVFDGARAYQDVLAQMKIGFRPTGSAGDRATGDYIIAQTKQAGWKTETQEFTFRGLPIRNVIAKAAEGKGPIIIVGAHYDSRLIADQDKQNPTAPMPGANDGGSGVAVLLELARTLDTSKLKNEIWLAFFDAADNGDISGCIVTPGAGCDATPWPWSVGAAYVAEHVPSKPYAMILLDMIGDMEQDIYYEQNSDVELQKQIWGIAAKLGYTRQFIPQNKWSMEDDHTPFLERGIRAVDMIDFDYPYWHTTQDTADKVSADSLERVGRVMKVWLESQ